MCYVPKNNQNIHLVRTITIKGVILVKIENFMPENASFQGYFTEVCFDTSEQNLVALTITVVSVRKEAL